MDKLNAAMDRAQIKLGKDLYKKHAEGIFNKDINEIELRVDSVLKYGDPLYGRY